MKRLVAHVTSVSLVAVLFASACACKSKADTGPGTGTGSGTGTGTGDAKQCETLAAHVEGLYRADADFVKLATPKDAEKDPAAAKVALDEAVADNVAMVLADCRAEPAKVVPCATKATTIATLEASCLIPLDEEGSEGTRFE